MSKKPCIVCGVVTTSSRCPAHTVNKPSSTSRGYGYQWQKARIQILNRDNWTCHYCGKKLVGSDATVDHIVPLHKDSSLALDPSNLVASCRSCNSRKQGR